MLRMSVTWRALMSLIGFVKYSVIGRFFGAFGRAYEHSRTAKVTDRLLGADATTTERSLFARMYSAVAQWTSRVGAVMRPATERSLVCRFWRWLQNSAIVRLLFGHSTRRLLVVMFALYLPIDWALREFSPVAALATAWDELFLAFGFAYAVFQRLLAPEDERPRVTPLDTLILAFCGLGVLLTVMTAEDGLRIGISGLRAVVQYMLWFFVLTRIMRDDGDVNAFVAAFVGIGILTALHGIAQYVLGVEIPEHWVSQAEVGVRSRAFSIFGSPNIMGSFMVMSAPLCASYAYRAKTTWKRALAWIGVLVIALACLVTFSRGAWLGFAVMVAAFAWLRDKRLFALVALALGFAVMVPDVVNRITFLFTDEFKHASQFGGRAGRWREGMRLLETVDPMFGYGLGRFGGAVAMQNQVNRHLSYFYLDNYYMKTLIEMGYLGLGGYIVLLVGTIWVGLRAVYRTKNTEFSAVACALLAGMVGVLVHCYTENIFEVPYMNAYFWGMAAVLVWLGFIRKGNTNEN